MLRATLQVLKARPAGATPSSTKPAKAFPTSARSAAPSAASPATPPSSSPSNPHTPPEYNEPELERIPAEDFGKFGPDGRPLPYRSMYLYNLKSFWRRNLKLENLTDEEKAKAQANRLAYYRIAFFTPITIAFGYELYRRRIQGKEQKVLAPGQGPNIREATLEALEGRR